MLQKVNKGGMDNFKNQAQPYFCIFTWIMKYMWSSQHLDNWSPHCSRELQGLQENLSIVRSIRHFCRTANNFLASVTRIKWQITKYRLFMLKKNWRAWYQFKLEHFYWIGTTYFSIDAELCWGRGEIWIDKRGIKNVDILYFMWVTHYCIITNAV